jgi:hypothetical protein
MDAYSNTEHEWQSLRLSDLIRTSTDFRWIGCWRTTEVLIDDRIAYVVLYGAWFGARVRRKDANVGENHKQKTYNGRQPADARPKCFVPIDPGNNPMAFSRRVRHASDPPPQYLATS